MSYLEGPSPDTESSQAALQAYFGEPVRTLPDVAQDHQNKDCLDLAFQMQAAQLSNIVSQAQVALEQQDVSAMQHALHEYPVSLAAKALEDAIQMISSRAGWSAMSDWPELPSSGAVHAWSCFSVLHASIKRLNDAGVVSSSHQT